MDKLLWTFEQVAEFASHPDLPLRRWGVQRLVKRFPTRAGELLVDRLDDANWFLSVQAARFLADTGDAERYGPTLLERLREPTYPFPDSVAMALARLDYREALPLILERLAGDSVVPGSNEHLGLVSALGTFGGDEARDALWGELERASQHIYLAGTVLLALLEAALPDDVPRLVEAYRGWPAGAYQGHHLGAFAVPAGAESRVSDVISALPLGFDAALIQAERWLGREITLSAECVEGLVSAPQRAYRGVFDLLLREARRLVDERGDDTSAWHATWQAGARPPGYRGQVVYTLCLLESFAAWPGPSRDQREAESGLGLALVFQLAVDHDDQARLDAAEDQAGALLSILAEDRENVLPDILDRVAALGPDVVPKLVDMLDPTEYGWGQVRLTRAIERLATLYPGSCDEAAPALVAVVHDEQGDFVLEGASAALEAIGPAAAAPMLAHLRDDDLSRQIYLTGSLAEMMTESAAQGLLDWLADGVPIDEMHISALKGIGSPSAIEPLYAEWAEDSDEGSLLEEALLVLCELNGVEKPELPEWRRAVAEQDERMASWRDHALSLHDPDAIVADDAPSPPPAPDARRWPKKRSVRQPRRVSRKERKKRAAQRRGKRKKKK